MEITNLNAGVKISTLYADLTEDQIKTIEEMSKDGFTTEELQQLKKDGIDTSLILQNGKTTDTEAEDGATATTATKEATDSDVAAKVKELKAKYSAEKGKGDPFKTTNPQLLAFKQALNDGLISDLAGSGFSKTQILTVISEVFPSIGIKGKAEHYVCPQGHDPEAREIYNQFISELAAEADGISQEIKAQREVISNICKQIQSNNNKISTLEVQIITLQDEIEEIIEKAIDESKEIVEEQKDDAKDVVSKCLNAYVNADGEMTYEEFQRNVADGLDNVAGYANSKLASVVTGMLNAERKMATLDGYLGQMSNLLKNNEQLNGQLNEAKTKLDELTAKKAEQIANGCCDKCCHRTDPIGFSDGKVRYDFFVDKDGNSNISNEKEFLGAQNGFEEVKALDTDGDGVVTKAELEKGNVKVVKTSSDGTQEIKNVSDVLGEGDSININTYKAQHTEMSNGNALVGTFKVSKDGQDLDGYQTLDTLDWLDENFNFTDADNSIGRHSTNFDESIEGVEAITDTTKYEQAVQRTAELRTKMSEVYTRLGFDEEEIREGISQRAEMEAEKTGNRIEEMFKKRDAEEAKKAEEAEAAKEAQEAKDAKKAEEEAKAAEEAEEAEMAEGAEENLAEEDEIEEL